MLSQLKQRIEKERNNRQRRLVDNRNGKSDVVSNKLVMGQDVTVQEFEDAVVNCFRTYKKRIAI